MEVLRILTYFFVFIIGALSYSLVLSLMPYLGLEKPFGNGINGSLAAPSDWITGEQIEVYDDKILIKVSNASLSKYAETRSMIPVLDSASNGIRIKPVSEAQIKVGDIVTFERDSNLIVHRVIEIGEDDLGKWFITKGDNSNFVDGRIRFKDIKYVTIGILW